MDALDRRSLLLMGLATGGAMVSASAAAAGAGAFNDPLAGINPQLRAVARCVARQAGHDMLTAATLPAFRKRVLALTRTQRKDVSVERRVATTNAGQTSVPIYVINADPAVHRGVIVYMHGGGYVAGAAVSDIARLQDLATELSCCVVAVEYRLAPETRFEGSTADTYTALEWVYDHADELGIDRGRMVVMGESAGGGHAALLAIRARDRGKISLRLQVLLYPMLDDRTGVYGPRPRGRGGWYGRRE